ncbi:MAG: cyclic nucleotide-binding domain-containing protein [Flavobacteriales bacterium]|nr:cyclic nucleotide-binding domain-containing protein [Flavobacteriales bacterium]
MIKEIEILKDFLKVESLLKEDEWRAFADIWQPYLVQRKETITFPGQTEKHLYFIMEGVQRIYHISKEDKEATLILTYPHSFGGVLDSFLLQIPSEYYYESLTPSLFLKASHQKFIEVTTAYPKLDQLMKQHTYLALSGLLERMVELQSFSSEEKFRTLLKRSPHILQLVPHKYLANYLGIDPTNFSKLINHVKI